MLPARRAPGRYTMDAISSALVRLRSLTMVAWAHALAWLEWVTGPCAPLAATA